LTALPKPIESWLQIANYFKGDDSMDQIDFSFSDTVAGYVTDFDRSSKSFGLKTSDGRQFKAYMTFNTFARVSQNLDEGYIDATGQMPELLTPGQLVYAYGVFYPQEDGFRFEVKSMVFPGQGQENYRHEEPDWWIRQIRSIANSYLKWQFDYPAEAIDYSKYRTYLNLSGAKKGDFLQETDTVSRLVYGFASAYLLTGEDKFLEAAEKGEGRDAGQKDQGQGVDHARLACAGCRARKTPSKPGSPRPMASAAIETPHWGFGPTPSVL